MKTLEQEIQEVLELADKATPGPWFYMSDNTVCTKCNTTICTVAPWRDEIDESDAAFIASAHTMASLLRRVLPMVKDAERLDHLQRTQSSVYIFQTDKGLNDCTFEGWASGMHEEPKKTVREAIDAAIQARASNG